MDADATSNTDTSHNSNGTAETDNSQHRWEGVNWEWPDLPARYDPDEHLLEQKSTTTMWDEMLEF